MDWRHILEGSAYLCLAVAAFVFFFRTRRRLKRAKRGFAEMEKILEENKPEGVDND